MYFVKEWFPLDYGARTRLWTIIELFNGADLIYSISKYNWANEVVWEGFIGPLVVTDISDDT